MAQFDYEGFFTATGKFLRRELKKHNMTQDTFANEFGCDVRTVRRWLGGEVHSLDVVVDVARFFGVSVGDVLSDEDGVPFPYKKEEIPIGQWVPCRNLFCCDSMESPGKRGLPTSGRTFCVSCKKSSV